MDKLKYKGYKLGDRVTVRQTENAYDSLGDIPPGMIGTIKAFPPKVRKFKGPGHDSGDYFAYVEFEGTASRGARTYQLRGGVNMCNLKKVK